MLADRVVAHDPATDAVAQKVDVPAHRAAEDHRVERREAVHLVGRHVEGGGDVADAFVRHPPAPALDDLQGLRGRGALLLVPPGLGLDLAFFLVAQHVLRSARAAAVQRSTSAST